MISVTIFLDLIDSPEDKAKFEALYNKYVKLVYWIVERKVHKHELAEECVQETFFRIARSFEKVGEVDSPATKAYVATIAQGIAINAYHKENRAVFVQMESEEELMSIIDPTEEFRADRVELMDLSAAIDSQLTEKERNLIYLKYAQNISVSEIARIYKTTDYFIRKQLNEAVYKLKSYLNKE